VESTPWEPRAQRSLALGVANVAPGALCALTVATGLTVAPKEGLSLRFGRNKPQVEVCIGENDLHVSRVHGLVHHRERHWWVSNTGRSPIRLSSSLMLHPEGEPLPLAPGYTPLFLRGSRGREHLLELYVAGDDGGIPSSRPNEATEAPKRWRLTADEHAALTVVGQRFLLLDPNPQPLSRQQAAEQLQEVRPDTGWTPKRVEHLVSAVRKRLSDSGVPGLRREEVGEPVGLTLTVNLLRELVLSTTLVPLDLALLDDPL
jgi:hypothetical protein